MCGRVRLSTDYSEIKIRLRFDDAFPAPNFPQRWNMPPTAKMLCAVRDPETDTRRPEMMRWGLIPAWAKSEKVGYTTFNARAEGLAMKPAFRGAWGSGRRCLIVTDGFYEWRQADKQPFAIGMKDGGLMVMAGLWETWRPREGESVKSCTIITTDSVPIMGELHDRMPVILAEQDWPMWLGETESGTAALHALLTPFRGEDMKIWPVGKAIGNVRNEGPELILPVVISG